VSAFWADSCKRTQNGFIARQLPIIILHGTRGDIPNMSSFNPPERRSMNQLAEPLDAQPRDIHRCFCYSEQSPGYRDRGFVPSPDRNQTGNQLFKWEENPSSASWNMAVFGNGSIAFLILRKTRSISNGCFLLRLNGRPKTTFFAALDRVKRMEGEENLVSQCVVREQTNTIFRRLHLHSGRPRRKRLAIPS
jgi:hypothetical protein